MGQKPPTFGQTLTRLLAERDMDVSELARLSGVSRPHLSRIRSGLREPAWGIVVRIARALQVDVGEFDAR